MGDLMKLFFSALFSLLLILSSALHAQVRDPIGELSLFLKLGTHQGYNTQGSCKVAVEFSAITPMRILKISVTDKKGTTSKEVIDYSDYKIDSDRFEFIQTERTYTSHDLVNYKENIIRTILTEENKLYVVVSNEVIRNTETTFQSVSECIIAL